MSGELADERSFKRALREATSELAREDIEEAVQQAVEYANESFARAADSPPEGASMDEWHLQPIIESVEVYWESGKSEGKLRRGDALVAEWTHPHTNKMEVGVEPHEIEGSPYLRWVDRDTGEVVYAQKVDHPGNPGIGAIRGGFKRVVSERFS